MAAPFTAGEFVLIVSAFAGAAFLAGVIVGAGLALLVQIRRPS